MDVQTTLERQRAWRETNIADEVEDREGERAAAHDLILRAESDYARRGDQR